MKYSLIVFLLFVSSANAKVWQVGPTRQFTAPSAVMPLVSDGDMVLIDSGLYSGDVGTWSKNNVVLKCPNGIARFDATGITISQKKGIWVIDGNNTYVEGCEFFGAAISYADGDNGAGIRLEGLGFTCRRCYFHDNQEGILTGNDTTNVIDIESCEFDHNGVETGGLAGYEHNIYVGHSSSCTIKFCYFHRAIMGHEIKSRSNVNYILYNYIVDDTDGDGSYSIDLPNGGESYVIGNAIEKGPITQNPTAVSYGEEGLINPSSEFYFTSNTVVTDRKSSSFLFIAAGAVSPLIANNIFAGPAQFINASATAFDTLKNVISADTAFFHFRNVLAYDYHPIDSFPGLNDGEDFGTVRNDGFTVSSISEYVHPLDSMPRTFPNYMVQIGAFNEIFSSIVENDLKSNPQLTNYPNPFSTETVIPLPTGTSANLELFNACGMQMDVKSELVENGMIIERGNLQEGIYFYRIIEPSRGTIAEGSLVIGN